MSTGKKYSKEFKLDAVTLVLEQDEIRVLKAQVKRLEMERDILMGITRIGPGREPCLMTLCMKRGWQQSGPSTNPAATRMATAGCMRP